MIFEDSEEADSFFVFGGYKNKEDEGKVFKLTFEFKMNINT